MFFRLCLSTKGCLYWSIKMWIRCTSCVIDQGRTECDRHTWCQLSEKPMLRQGRALLLVVTMAYKPIGDCENFLLGEDGAHIQFSKASQLSPVFLHSASMPQSSTTNLFCTRDWFHGRHFFHGPEWADGFRIIQANYIYCALISAIASAPPWIFRH